MSSCEKKLNEFTLNSFVDYSQKVSMSCLVASRGSVTCGKILTAKCFDSIPRSLFDSLTLILLLFS